MCKLFCFTARKANNYDICQIIPCRLFTGTQKKRFILAYLSDLNNIMVLNSTNFKAIDRKILTTENQNKIDTYWHTVNHLAIVTIYL